jgi:hypothetical protein
MSNNNELKVTSKNNLLDIFLSEEDRNGTDLLSMSNYFEVFVSKLNSNLEENGKWEIIVDSANVFCKIAAAIKSGIDITESKMLVADTSHFSKDIVDGLKSGLYHMGQSREITGNLRPAVLDEKDQLVKFVTLKKAVNPSEILTDMENVSMQLSLNQISGKIKEVGRNVQGISEFIRREKLSNKFINARGKIKLAATADAVQREQYLKEVDTYLMEGLTSLYSDINANVKKLAELKGPFISLKNADTILIYINEDMQMIPRYVGLRVYLLNFRGNVEASNKILDEYRYHIENLAERKLDGSKYTAFEIIHRYYPYTEENTDFWLEQPREMLSVLKNYENLIEQTFDDVIYIDMENCADE